MTRLILGIDPGSIITGYGLIENRNDDVTLVTAGLIKNIKDVALEKRLNKIYEELSAIIERYKPEEMAIEDVFYAKNAKSALILGHVRGVCLLAATRYGLKIYKYPATIIKQSITGNGRADKRQVQYMVKCLLNHQGNLNMDASDALAVALCHINHESARKQSRLCSQSLV